MVKKLQQPKYSSTIQALLARIDEFLAQNKHLDEKTFGWYSIKDSKLVSRLRAGGDITTKKLDLILRYLANPST